MKITLRKGYIFFLSIIILYIFYTSICIDADVSGGEVDDRNSTTRMTLEESETAKEQVLSLVKSSETEEESKYTLLGKSFRLFKHVATKWPRAVALQDAKTELLQILERSIFPWTTSDFSLKVLQNATGNGVVICAGDQVIEFALANIVMIRQVHKSNIPIQVFYAGSADLSKENRKKLREIPNVRPVDITRIFDNEILHLERWAIKPFALLASSFENTVLMDADVTLLQSPERFFSQPEYLETGALFFNDRSMTDTVKNWKRAREIAIDLVGGKTLPAYSSLQKLRFFSGGERKGSPRTNYQMESGVVVVDKIRHIHALFAVCALNVGATRKELYEVSYGEKETYWMAFEAIGNTYSFNSHAAAVLGPEGQSATDGSGDAAVCGANILHLDADGNPFWFNGSLQKRKKQGDAYISAEIWTEEKETQVWKWEYGTICLFTRSPNSLSTKERKIIDKGIEIMKQTFVYTKWVF